MRSVIALILVFSVLAGTSYYLSDRLYRGISAFFPGIRFWPVLLIMCSLTLILVVGFSRALTPFPTGVKRILGDVSGYYMGVFIYLLMFTVLSDLVLAVPRIMKLRFTAHHLFSGYVTVAVLVLTAVTCIYGFINARQIDHVTYSIDLESRKVESDINVVMISDLHLGAIGSESRLCDIVSEINKEEPDVVCIAGDFFDTDFSSIRDPNGALEAIRGIRSTYGVYACLGNHDGGSTHSQMREFLNEAGITVLDDAYEVIDDRFVLVGRLDGSAIGGYDGAVRKPISDYFTREDTSLPVIVLDHNPANIGEYGAEADIILCGHTHKGQVFPANIITDLIYSVDHGYYRKDADSPHVVVSSGVGTWGMPMRVGTDSEVVSVRITSGK